MEGSPMVQFQVSALLINDNQVVGLERSIWSAGLVISYILADPPCSINPAVTVPRLRSMIYLAGPIPPSKHGFYQSNLCMVKLFHSDSSHWGFNMLRLEQLDDCLRWEMSILHTKFLFFCYLAPMWI